MANKIYVTPEAAITWRNAGGDNVLTLTSLAAGAGRQGALDDFHALLVNRPAPLLADLLLHKRKARFFI